jgi:hypothetical protein
MPSYTTLQSVLRQLGTRAPISATRELENYVIADLIPVASERIDTYCGQNFDERVLTLGFNSNPGATPILSLEGYPLLAVTTLTNGNGSVIASSAYTLLPTGIYPKEDIRLTQGNYWRSPGTGTDDACAPYPYNDPYYDVQAVQVAGLWGFNRKGTNAWKNTGLTVSTNYDNGDPQIVLSDVAGTALDVGSVLKIGDEQFRVTGDVANSTEDGYTSATIDVEPAYNNTTGADHVTGAVVYVYQNEYTVHFAADLTVAWMYETQLDSGNEGGTSTIEGHSMPLANDLPSRVKGALGQPPWRNFYRGLNA